jgi:hypothetical protein
MKHQIRVSRSPPCPALLLPHCERRADADPRAYRLRHRMLCRRLSLRRYHDETNSQRRWASVPRAASDLPTSRVSGRTGRVHHHRVFLLGEAPLDWHRLRVWNG